ncbi:MAG: hydrogen peroxide-dependent heme synthase [Candidatus Binataceae bacterium]
MKHERGNDSISTLPAVPYTLEGFSILHQFFRLRRREWNALEAGPRGHALDEAGGLLTAMARREDGQSGLFVQLGHKGDLIIVHFRRDFEQLSAAELEIGRLRLSEFLEPVTSYLSVVEIGLYEATVKLSTELVSKGLRPDSPDWQNAAAEELASQRKKLAARLYPKIPERRYLCFYPMNKRRAGNDNWYALPIEKRREQMHEHGMIGRRYAGQVTQIISGSIGFDDWEWGVDLFADDPLVFKKLVYEMRFDESSARYAEFGPFHFGIRLDPAELSSIFAVPA